MEPAGYTHRAIGIMGQVRGNFQTHESIRSLRGAMHVPQEVAGFLNVPYQQLLIDLISSIALARQTLDVVVVITAPERQSECSGVSGDASQTFVFNPAL
jgi:hypothetical protein